MQTFYINQGSTLPTLIMEVVEDGRHDFRKNYDMLQSADITFTMVNTDNGITKIAKAPAYIRRRENGGCEERYVVCYDWRERDTKEKGIYAARFDIKFSGLLTGENIHYPQGNLVMPIREELQVIIK